MIKYSFCQKGTTFFQYISLFAKAERSFVFLGIYIVAFYKINVNYGFEKGRPTLNKGRCFRDKNPLASLFFCLFLPFLAFFSFVQKAPPKSGELYCFANFYSCTKNSARIFREIFRSSDRSCSNLLRASRKTGNITKIISYRSQRAS